MRTLEEMAPRVEVYSIDEAFLDLSHLAFIDSLKNYGFEIKNKVAKECGIPICIGIAETKTLAKLANHAAKQYPKTGGVVEINSEKIRERSNIVNS